MRPEMSSRRNLVLAFVRDYIGTWRVSPSYGEIAAGLGTNRTRIKEAVRSLVADGHLLRTPGPRGLALPGDEAAAIERLKALGWRVDAEARALAAVTQSTLPAIPLLDYPEA